MDDMSVELVKTDACEVFDGNPDASLDLLEQQQAKEQARLLQRFRELRQWQQQQQQKLMQQQQMQLDMLRDEQLRVQTLITTQRGAYWGDGRVIKHDGFRKSSPPVMTPPRRTVAGTGLGIELSRTIKAIMPQLSADSGLVTSMGDTLEHPQDSLPRPIMYSDSPNADEDRYTNPELFSNPGSYSDDLQAVDERLQQFDAESDFGSDNFVLPPLPPDPNSPRLSGRNQNGVVSSLSTLQALLNTTAPHVLQQMLGILPMQQKLLLHERQQAAVEESASPDLSPVTAFARGPRQSLAAETAPLASSMSSLQTFPSQPSSFMPHLQNSSQHQVQRPVSHSSILKQPSGEQHTASTQPPQFSHGPQADQSHYQPQNVELRVQSSSQNQQTYKKRPDQPQDSVVVGDPQSRQLQQRFVLPKMQNQSQHRLFPAEGTGGGIQQKEDTKEEADKTRGNHEANQRQTEKDEEEEEEEELEVTVRQVISSPDDRPIKPGLQGKKTFEQLLEEQLASEQQLFEEERNQIQSPYSTRRPFLRKGQGIARYSKPIKRPPKRTSSGGQKTEIPRITGSAKSGQGPGSGTEGERTEQFVKSLANKRQQPERKRTNNRKDAGKKFSDSDPPQQDMLKLIKRKSETGKKLLAESDTRDKRTSVANVNSISGTYANPVPGTRVNPVASCTVEQIGMPGIQASQLISRNEDEENDVVSDDASFVSRLKEREIKAPEEAKELEEFELLEDIADNMSLVSNSSVVARLITPNKQKQRNAVSDLKTVLDKKKNVTTSPFERNTAMRSLLMASGSHSTMNRLQQQVKESSAKCPDQDQALVGEKDNCDSSSDTITVSSSDDSDKDDDKFSHGEQKSGVPFIHAEVRTKDSSEVSEGICSKPEMPNGLEFSKRFSLFDQHRTLRDNSNNTDTQQHNSNSGSDVPLSPTKSVTRKVATLQSRLAAANDTAILLQRLTSHAGYLSSGFSRTIKEQKSPEVVEVSESGDETSMTSFSVPQPFILGPSGENGARESSKLMQDSNGSNKRLWKTSSRKLEEDERGDAELEKNANKEFHDEGSNSETHDQITDNPDFDFVNVNHNNNCDGDNYDNNPTFDDEDEWIESAPHVTQQVNRQEMENASTPPTSKFVSRLFPNLKPKVTKAQEQQQQKLQMAVTTNVGDGVPSKLMREKLAELETEIERFRSENAALEKLRKEREEGINKLKEEITRFEREKTDELARLEEFKAQETKKLKHERKLFETYQKQVRSIPDKKEREEIDMLKRQLTELQDEMRRKESRWTSNVTRLKGRISELETENVELRDEIKILEQKRLEWMQVQSSSKQQMSNLVPPAQSSNLGANSNIITNGFHNNTVSTSESQKLKVPATSLNSGAANSALSNSSGMYGKTTSSPLVAQSTSGGESMPRGLVATPSIIEGISLTSLVGETSEGPSMPRKQVSLPQAAERPNVDKGNRQFEESQYPDGKIERMYSNGAREVLFANGTRKEISSDGQYIVVSFFNGDIKQIFPDQRVVYYYAEAQTTHTTYPDKLEVLQFPNNQTEKHYPDGTKEIIFPDQTVKYLFPNGTEESIFQDGTIMRIDQNGERILVFPNGQREIHTQHYKRREYPDGTVKTLHNDGRQETRYSNGRVRLKDKDGNVLMDRIY